MRFKQTPTYPTASLALLRELQNVHKCPATVHELHQGSIAPQARTISHQHEAMGIGGLLE